MWGVRPGKPDEPLMQLLFLVVTLPVLIAYALLSGYVLANPRRMIATRLVAILIALGILISILPLLPPEARAAGRVGRGFALMAAAIGLMTAFGMLVYKDLRRPRAALRWEVFGGLWLVAAVLATALDGLSLDGVQPPRVTAGDVAVTAGFVIAISVLIGTLLNFAVREHLPEVANRTLLWMLLAGLLANACGLLGTGLGVAQGIGIVTLLAPVIGAAYLTSGHRTVDVRGNLRRITTALLVAQATGSVVFVTLYFVNGWALDSNVDKLMIFGLTGAALGALYIPLWLVIWWLLAVVLPVRDFDPARLTRDYGQQVSQAVSVKEIVTAATGALHRVMGIPRSALLLVNTSGDGDGDIELLAMEGGIFPDRTQRVTLNMKVNGPLYRRLAVEQRPLSQYDLLYDPVMAGTTAEELAFFDRWEMHAYAPILMDSVMIGLLMVGAKRDDTIYQTRDLTVLSSVAQQIGFALRNARLVADLRHLNSSMRSLNRGLEQANTELEHLDNVKTDFVTIASHELRTPLAQIRGYTDVLDAFNESGMLEKDQVSNMVHNLRGASERMDELISAMLDVSQIDVNAMNLHFADTTPEAVLKQAVEPLTDEIRQRRLNLTARWKGLPVIQADEQRLVQAFRNVVVNAIKFTPDGGHIEIQASLQPAERPDAVDQILVTVKDTGVGIDRENLELIFHKFYRTGDTSRHSSGTYKFLGGGPGLGLTIAKGVIEAHGGQIWAESERYSLQDFPGTTIYVLLPVSQQETGKRILTFDSAPTLVLKRKKAQP